MRLRLEMTMDDFHQLAAAHCPALPRSLVAQACGHLVEPESSAVEIPFRRIMTCFRACLVYNGQRIQPRHSAT